MTKAELETLATSIASHMSGWSMRPTEYEHGVKLADSGGHSLFLCTSWAGKDRLHISGDYPRKGNTDYGRAVIPYHDKLPSITVAMSKEPKAIASDIIRRILPAYLDIHAKAVARKAQDEQYVADCDALRQRLKAIHSSLRERGDALHWHTNDSYGDVKVTSSVSLDIHNVSADKAEAILRVLLAE